MDRRSFFQAVGASILLVQSRGRCATTLPRVALVFNGIPLSTMPTHRLDQAFVRGLRERGLEDGRTIVLMRRSAEGREDRLPQLMQELVTVPVDVIVTIGPAVGAARRATRTIAIVAVATDGLVESGAVVSLARPGGNVTGITGEVDPGEMGTKRLELLREMAPSASRVAVLGYALKTLQGSNVSSLESAARKLGQTIVWVDVRTRQDLVTALATLEKNRIDALYVEGAPVNYSHVSEIAAVGERLKLPSIFEFREGPEHGGLMSYGADIAESFRHAAVFVDRILKGAKPSDLPMEQPTTFELIINQRVARILGRDVPQSLLQRAAEVFQ